MGAFIDMSGKRVGRWTIGLAVRTNPKLIFWGCVCDCGNRSLVAGHSLRSGHSRSCGCLGREEHIERETTHGMTGTRLHGIWKGMLNRCSNANDRSYKNYGALGISVCERWQDFGNFYSDMGPTYEDGLTIDRKESKLGYAPDNCRWLSRADQSRNRRSPREWQFKTDPISTNKSGFRGVSWNRARQKWHASICVNRKQKNLGDFETKEQARDAYLEARRTMR